MMKVGTPKPAVQMKMRHDGLDPSILDLDPKTPLSKVLEKAKVGSNEEVKSNPSKPSFLDDINKPGQKLKEPPNQDKSSGSKGTKKAPTAPKKSNPVTDEMLKSPLYQKMLRLRKAYADAAGPDDGEQNFCNENSE
jgi:hypothetical protein